MTWWESVILGIVSSIIASVILGLINLIIKLVVNKSKLKAIIMVMFNEVGYDATNKCANKLQSIEDVFTYNQYINLIGLSTIILNKKKAKIIVDCVGRVVDQVTNNQPSNIIINEINQLNDLFVQY